MAYCVLRAAYCVLLILITDPRPLTPDPRLLIPASWLRLVHFGTRGQKGWRTPFPYPANICYNKVLSPAGRNQERFGGFQALGI